MDNSIADRNMEDIDEDEMIFEEERDLLVSDREDNVLQFLQALDLQVIGACRADERLIPLLKTSVPAEDCLLAHLIQHFEAQEIGMLVRCLCVPLVSIRVGRVIKQGNLLCPTSIREKNLLWENMLINSNYFLTEGTLKLAMLPSSNLRISFTGDDGCSERLVTLHSNCKDSAVMIEDIPADNSGRSFVLKFPSRQVYFWCSEKSMLLGTELLAKMKDVLERKPSLAELTGINETRLECFAVHFHDYLLGITASNTRTNETSLAVTDDSVSQSSKLDSVLPTTASILNLSLPQYSSVQAVEANSHSDLEDFASVPIFGTIANVNSVDNNLSEGSLPFCSSLGYLESGGGLASLAPSNQFLQGLASSTDPTGGPLSSPFYYPFPPCTSILQFAEVPRNGTNSLAEPFLLPPLSSLLSGNKPFLLPPLSSLLSGNKPSGSYGTLDAPCNLVESLNLTAFLSDPIVQLPLSLATVSTSQQIATFTPLMCDPIVHIPALGVCSSGQSFLVGAGRAIPTAIPLHPQISNPSFHDTALMAEKGARETLQLLLNSSQTSPWSRDVLPAMITSGFDIHEHHLLDVGSRHPCSKTEVDAFPNIIAMDFVSLPDKGLWRIKGNHGIGDLDSSNQFDETGYSQSDDLNSDAVG